MSRRPAGERLIAAGRELCQRFAGRRHCLRGSFEVPQRFPDGSGIQCQQITQKIPRMHIAGNHADGRAGRLHGILMAPRFLKNERPAREVLCVGSGDRGSALKLGEEPIAVRITNEMGDVVQESWVSVNQRTQRWRSGWPEFLCRGENRGRRGQWPIQSKVPICTIPQRPQKNEIGNTMKLD